MVSFKHKTGSIALLKVCWPVEFRTFPCAVPVTVPSVPWPGSLACPTVRPPFPVCPSGWGWRGFCVALVVYPKQEQLARDVCMSGGVVVVVGGCVDLYRVV